ncbi:hypothetical protein PITC_029290 [Penicillium italicum]|uniref:Uncharacterized protein n=1 Tax=Penicillium italicum TaxID=40296 RepID=A0A0A2KUC3_PENIT|nr:hypothetical protein PITC_029290 [Penicillium italicum]
MSTAILLQETGRAIESYKMATRYAGYVASSIEEQDVTLHEELGSRFLGKHGKIPTQLPQIARTHPHPMVPSAECF